MTDLRLWIARAIGATMRLPNHTDRADEVLNAIEAAGYAIVPRALAVTTDADAVAAARFASLEDTTLLAKET